MDCKTEKENHVHFAKKLWFVDTITFEKMCCRKTRGVRMGSLDSSLEAFCEDLWFEWSFMGVKMLVYGSDLWEALNERLLAENTTSIFGCQVSMGYCGRGFAWNEAPLSVWKCTWDVCLCRWLKWQQFFLFFFLSPSQYNRWCVKSCKLQFNWISCKP